MKWPRIVTAIYVISWLILGSFLSPIDTGSGQVAADDPDGYQIDPQHHPADPFCDADNRRVIPPSFTDFE